MSVCVEFEFILLVIFLTMSECETFLEILILYSTALISELFLSSNTLIAHTT